MGKIIQLKYNIKNNVIQITPCHFTETDYINFKESRDSQKRITAVHRNISRYYNMTRKITYNLSLMGSCVLIYKRILYMSHSLEEHWLKLKC